MPRLSKICLALGLCFGSTGILAATSCVQAGSQQQVLEVAPAVGDSTQAVVYRLSDGQWLIPLSALGHHASGVAATCDVEGIPHAMLQAGDIAAYDEHSQKLTIAESLRRTATQTLSLGSPSLTYSPVELGLRSILDFTLLRTDEQMRAGAFSENSFRTRNWLLYSGATVGNLTYGVPATLFLDTYARKENIAERTYFQLGDSAYLSNLTGRAARMTGLSFGRGIAINPWYLPYSYSTVNATSVVPSAVEVFVNQQRVQKQSVDAGPFSIVNMAGPIGYGEYRVLTRDALGRVQVTTQSFYNSPEIIARRFLEYHVGIGGIRKNYGISNYDFGGVAQIGHLRYGLTENITIGAQATRSPEAASIGIKPAYRIRTLGVITGVLQIDKAGNGLWSVAAERASGRYSMRAEVTRADAAYRDVLVDDRFPMPLNTLSLRGSYRFNRGSLSLSHLAGTTQMQGRTVINSLGAQYSVNSKWMLIATAGLGRSNGERDLSLFVGAIVNFGGGMTSLTSATKTPEGISYQAALSGSPGAAAGFGYELTSASQSNGAYAQGRGIWNADAFRGEIETNNKGSTRLRVKTSVAVTKDSFFVGRPSADAFVLVDTDGIPGVEVGGPSDRYVVTNEKGLALFPGLSANVAQNLTVNVDKLPLDIKVTSEQQQIIPPQMGIVRAKFALAKVTPVTVHLVDTEGRPLTRGAVALVPGQENHVIGSEGALYLESAKNIKRIEVRVRKTTCVFDLTAPLEDEQTLKASRCD